MLGVHVHLTDDDDGRALLVYNIEERLMLPNFKSVSKQSEKHRPRRMCTQWAVLR